MEVTDRGVRIHTTRGRAIDIAPEQLYRPVVDRGPRGMGVFQFDNDKQRRVAFSITYDDAVTLRSLPYYRSLKLIPRFAKNPRLLRRVEH